MSNPVRVELLPGEDPRVYDAVTGEEVTSRVRSLELQPHRAGVATLLLLRDGKPYFDGETRGVAGETRPIAAMSGTWASR